MSAHWELNITSLDPNDKRLVVYFTKIYPSRAAACTAALYSKIPDIRSLKIEKVERNE